MNPVDYNKLPLVATAAQRFKQQLDDKKITREDLFSELAPIFQAPGNQAFGVCLVYRHYRLREGERIITNGNASSPSTDISSSILAERWLSTGTAFEYRLADGAGSPTPPSPAFLASVGAVLQKYNIDTLGVCSATPPSAVPLLQIAGTGDRERFISPSAPASSFDGPKVYEVSWTPTSNKCTMASDESFSARKYNATISVSAADQAFNEQLDQSPSGPVTREELFAKLAPLFVDSNGKPGPFAVFLVHRHHKLNNGERMVSVGNTTRPSTERADLVPERWFSTGEEFEHRSTAGGASITPVPVPSPDFLANFKKIVDEHGVHVLGVALASDTSSLPPDHVLLERLGSGDRELNVTEVHKDEAQGPDVFQSSWVPTVDSMTLRCQHNCTSSSC